MFVKISNKGFFKKAISVLTAVAAVLTAAASIPAVSAEDENALYIAAEASGEWFGQQVALEEGKEYEFSFYQTPDNNCSAAIYKDLSEHSISSVKFYDDNYFKITARFIVPSDALEGENGKKLVWVGIRTGGARSKVEYCARLKLCAADLPENNLLNDSNFTAGGDLWSDTGATVWKSAYGNNLSLYRWYVTSLSGIGGMDAFRRTEDSVNILWLSAELDYKWFGQFVSLEAGRKYTFSFYQTAGNNCSPVIYKDKSEGIIETEKTYDTVYNKITASFTVPDTALDDGNGKKLVYVGLRTGSPRSGYEYCAKLNLHDEQNPDINLLADSIINIVGSYDVDSRIWQGPYGESLPYGFWVRKIKEVGTFEIFKKPIVEYKVKFNTLTETEISEQTVKSGDKAVKPEDPTRRGYVFADWYSDETMSTPWDFETAVDRDITLTAKWVLKGDTDGNSKLDIIDLIRIKKHICGIQALDGDDLLAAKISGEDTVSTTDMAILRKRLIGATEIE